jgi:thioredoxin-related protein
MKQYLSALFAFVVFISPEWYVDFDKAKELAQTDHKYILLNFSGSDWCGPCIRMKKDIFDAESFKQFANDHLILVNADFPRIKKHALASEQQKKNDQLADRYNPQGIFPFTLLMTAEGKVVKTWEGLPPVSADDYIKQVQSITNAGN